MVDNKDETELLEEIRYICRVIDNGQFSLELKWSSVIGTIAYALDIDETRVARILGESDIGFTDDKGADFLVAGVFDAVADKHRGEEMFRKILDLVRKETVFTNLLALVSSQYDFSLALLEFLFKKQGHQLDIFRNSTLLPLITSDMFIESSSVNKFVKELVKGVEVDFEAVKELVKNDWFMDVMTILKSEVTVNQSSGYLRLIDREAHSLNAGEILSMISNGTLEMVVLHRNRILKQKFVMNAFQKRYEAEQHEKKLRRFYYWLGIINDFILGILFLVGSIEFLPWMPPSSLLIGVILFIVGSVQLVARSVIQIVMNLHIRTSRKKKLREVGT